MMGCGFWLAAILSLLILSPDTHACTLWSATGKRVGGGGSLIVKNRDWIPDHYQELRLITSSGSSKYIGIFAVGGKSPGLKGGINEHGLVVVSATAGSIPRMERKAMPRTNQLLNKILSCCPDVETALETCRKNKWFEGPAHLLLADRHATAVVEIAPDGLFASQITHDGFLFHTNHYLDEILSQYNRKIGESSASRLRRISELSKTSPHPFAVEDFISFADDRHAGADNSIWRTGKSEKSPRTLMSWIVALPPDDSPLVYVRMANPGERERIFSFCANDVFEGKADLSHIGLR